MTPPRSTGIPTRQGWLLAALGDGAFWVGVILLYLWAVTPARGQDSCYIDPITGQKVCPQQGNYGWQSAGGALEMHGVQYMPWEPQEPWQDPRVVKLRNKSATPGMYDVMTGSIVNIDGDSSYVITCAHGEGQPGDPVLVCSNDGRTLDIAKLVDKDTDSDVALLRLLGGPRSHYYEIAEVEPPSNTRVMGGGFMDGKQWGSGYSNLVYEQATYPDGRPYEAAVLTDGGAYQGQSGGPIVLNTRLVGVIHSTDGQKTYGCRLVCINKLLDRVFPSRKRRFFGSQPPPYVAPTQPITPVQPSNPPLAGTPIEPVIPPPAINLPPKTPSGIPSVVGDVVPTVADGFKYGPAIAAAAGIGGPIGIGIAIAGGLIGRRIKTRVVRRVTERFTTTPAATSAPTQSAVYTKYHPVAVDSPPPPQVTATETHYVPVEQDRFRRAHDWAKDQIARKYPGATDILSNMDSLINQQLAGQRN